MKITMFYQSLVSEYNFAGANFLRGIVSELLHRGHDVTVYEPLRSACLENLVSLYGDEPVKEFRKFYKDRLKSKFYQPEHLDLNMVLQDTDLVIVHEMNDKDLIKKIGLCRKQKNNLKALFHDPSTNVLDEKFDAGILKNYDGILAGCNFLRDKYLEKEIAEQVWVWHEAIDSRVFYPMSSLEKEGDVVCIGNWGKGEREDELERYLINPVSQLNLRSSLFGVGYPEDFIEKCIPCNISYRNWVANYKIPSVLSAYSVALHLPKRSYTQSVPGKPATGIFEAMACGIPVLSAPWEDTDSLFNKEDYVLTDEKSVQNHLNEMIRDKARAEEIAGNARRTINKKHTTWHRVDQLMTICEELGISSKENKGEQEAA